MISSPSKSALLSSSYIGDRYIPFRNSLKWDIQFNLQENQENRRCSNPRPSDPSNYQTPANNQQQQNTNNLNSNINNNSTQTTNSNDSNKDITMYRAVLRNELLGTSIDGLAQHHTNLQMDNFYSTNPSSNSQNINTNNNNHQSSQQHQTPPQIQSYQNRQVLQPREMTSVFQYKTPFKIIDENNSISSSLYSHNSPYSLSPLSPYSQKLLRSPRKPIRKISKVPFKVLDAPELQDDFYLNLVDWSSTNVLGVGLGTSVYLWSACTSQVTKLCDLGNREDSVSSVSWSEKGNYIAVGTFKGEVQIWDAQASKLVSTLTGHTARVGALAWNHDLLCSGSRDRNVFLRDIRTPAYEQERKLTGHKQEVCGLKWSPDHMLLASGGNDNKLLVWNVNGGNTPIQTYNDHIAAVKAIAWSPHQHGLLASGGGTADRCIRFWNTLTGQNLQSVDTGSQVCNLAWSKHSNELVSTHGYSQNQILIWKYPSMTQLAKLTGHTYRVLYLAVSPDGEAIVTGAGDETLRFWNVFNKSRCTKESKSALNLFGKIR
ncbi:unnamed protein product [Brachionus calyciflorus]|uniref:Fizzy-related protein homolog n=2 Tax=Brachionus calyciflorus TaxID=104777 RepID=A0A813VHS2_9BILA|nr:unnamed protein product [Brachionus calyciflorus]